MDIKTISSYEYTDYTILVLARAKLTSATLLFVKTKTCEFAT